MALILAIESDRRQVNHLTAMVRGKLHAELVLGDSAEGALDRLGDRVPDLILASPLLSPKDEQALSDRLRGLNGMAAHVQMLTLPVFASPSSRQAPAARGGVLSALLGERAPESAPDGCDPAVFAEQCQEYLRRAEEEKDARRHEEHDEQNDDAIVTVDIDLSDLLEEEPPPPQAASADEDEPAVYELSADAMEFDLVAPPNPRAADASKGGDPVPPPSPSFDIDTNGADEFDDWQQVVDALKRESAQIRVPRERKPDPPVRTAPPAPTPASKIAADPPKRRLRAVQDEWGMFDPAQAGMAALYERLQKLNTDDERR
jgi:hypothetical protein